MLSGRGNSAKVEASTVHICGLSQTSGPSIVAGSITLGSCDTVLYSGLERGDHYG
jgi:hypothetical protein